MATIGATYNVRDHENEINENIKNVMEDYLFEQLTEKNLRSLVRDIYKSLHSIKEIQDCVIFPVMPLEIMVKDSLFPKFDICINSWYGKLELRVRYDKVDGIVIQTTLAQKV